MKKQVLKLLFLFLSIVLINSSVIVEANEVISQPTPSFSRTTLQLKDDMRKLWTDHALWTRSYIVSAVSGMDDQKEVLARLLKNQEDIGNAIKPYYGETAGSKLTDLLKQHIEIAGNLIEAAKTGDEDDIKKYNSEWIQNADEMVQFLSSANPNWNQNELKELLHMHLQHVTDIVTARINKDWDADIIAFDIGLAHLINLADTLTEGILKQFPKQF